MEQSLDHCREGRSIAPDVTGEASAAFCLDWWAEHTAIRTEHTTVAVLGTEHRATGGADIDDLTGVSRHDQGFRVGALWAGKDRLKDTHTQLLD